MMTYILYALVSVTPVSATCNCEDTTMVCYKPGETSWHQCTESNSPLCGGSAEVTPSSFDTLWAGVAPKPQVSLPAKTQCSPDPKTGVMVCKTPNGKKICTDNSIGA